MAVPISGGVQHAPASSLLPLSLVYAVAVVSIFGLAGAATDVILHQEVRLYFGVGFGIGSALAAILVERRELVRTVIWIPLVYLALLLIGTGVSGHSHPTSWLILAIVFKAPVVMIGWSAAVVVGGLRGIARRRSH